MKTPINESINDSRINEISNTFNSKSFVQENAIERLQYVKDNVLRIKRIGFENYKKHHTKFINAQFDIRKRVFLTLATEENGIEKLSQLTGATPDLVKRFVENFSKHDIFKKN